jgi:hypothetical protein
MSNVEAYDVHSTIRSMVDKIEKIVEAASQSNSIDDISWHKIYGIIQDVVEPLWGWKKSAIEVMPDMQAIGKELGLTVGQSVHDKILPGILKLKQELSWYKQNHAQVLEEVNKLVELQKKFKEDMMKTIAEALAL